MKLLWLTDLHLRGASEPGHDQSVARFEAVIAHALSRHGDADRLLITGDIADTGTAEQYGVFEALRVGNTPVTRLLPGNHDVPEVLQSAMPDWNWAHSGGGFEEVIAGHHIIYLDTHAPGRDAGHIGMRQLTWLDGVLIKAAAPVLIFMHHQPCRVFLPSADTIGLEDQEAFQAILARHKDRIAHIFFGHCHRPISGNLHGIAITGLPAVARQMSANFATADFIADDSGSPCYGVIVAEQGVLACHTIEVLMN